jgi:hypothetical protein
MPKPVFWPPSVGTCLRCSFVSASTGWNLHAQAMQFLVILLLRFSLHAAMRSRVVRAIVSPSCPPVPPDPACTLHCTTSLLRLPLPARCPVSVGSTREYCRAAGCCSGVLSSALTVSAHRQHAIGDNRHATHTTAAHATRTSSASWHATPRLAGPSPLVTGPARGGKPPWHGLRCVFADCMLCRPYARCRIGGILLVAFYNSWQSDPPTRIADVEAHRSNHDADALPTYAADRRRVADNTQHSTCGMQHRVHQPATCAQALSSTLRGRLETTTPMAERASLERAEPVSLAPSARPEYSEYPT